MEKSGKHNPKMCYKLNIIFSCFTNILSDLTTIPFLYVTLSLVYEYKNVFNTKINIQLTLLLILSVVTMLFRVMIMIINEL